MRALTLVISLFMFTFAHGAHESFKGTIYEKDSSPLKELYKYEHKVKAEDKKVSVENHFFDLEGKEVTTEFAEIAPGEKVIMFKQIQKQLEAEGLIEVKDDKVYFTYTKDGKTKKEEEKLKDNFVVTPTVIPYLQKNWEQIKAGKDVDIRLGVVDRLETVGFRFKKDREDTFDGKKVLLVRLEPSTWAIRQIVDPLTFTMSEDGSRLLQLVGRTPLKKNVNGKWKDLDALTKYIY